MRVAAGGSVLGGAAAIAAGLWGLWGWPWAVIFLGVLLLAGGLVLASELTTGKGGR